VATAYAVDRSSELTEGAVLDRVRYTDLDPPFLQSHVDALFSEGVTRHGEAYLLRNQPGTLANPNIELIFEYVRRARFPDCPPRFESVYGFETLVEAETFRSNPNWGQPGAPIWELSAEEVPFRADMTCLTLGGSILVISQLAERYWSGQPNPWVPRQ
jgi:hypothetical protein